MAGGAFAPEGSVPGAGGSMTLTPESRVLLTDALRPPSSFRVDAAVGTTYSLDLMSMLLAPLSFALNDGTSAADIEAADPIRLLEAVSRYAEVTTVFCQAGGIHVPSTYRSVLTFIEDAVIEVTPPTDQGMFHPKVWALRFVSDDGQQYFHRAVISSRNLTQDRSWDTALVLDEAEDGQIEGQPLAEFVRALPGLASRNMADARAGQVASLAASMAEVRFATPAPFTGGHLVPIGLTGEGVWPFPKQAKRLLAVSPFLTRGALRALARVSPNRELVSRQESLDYVGADALAGWDLWVMQRLAELGNEAPAVHKDREEERPAEEPADEEGLEFETAVHEAAAVREGLHAKTFVMDEGGGMSRVVTGSANLTRSPWGGSVEFNAVLTGPTKACGVSAMLDGSKEVPGLVQVLEHATVEHDDGLPDAAMATEYKIEAYHRGLAITGIELGVTELDVSERETQRVQVVLNVGAVQPEGFETQVWLVSLPDQKKAMGSDAAWEISPDNLTPFLAIETTAGEGDARATRRCVVKATLTGDVGDRRRNAISTVLKNRRDVLRYLIFLLGDPASDALAAELSGATAEGDGSGSSASASADIALFEPLVRAVGRDEAALARVARAVDQIRQSDVSNDLLPDGFDELWRVVWAVHKEVR